MTGVGRCRPVHGRVIDAHARNNTCEPDGGAWSVQRGVVYVTHLLSVFLIGRLWEERHSVQPGLMILGDLSIQGNIKAVKSLSEPLQVGMDNGARRALIPLENKRSFLEVSGDVIERVDPIFYADPMTAAMKGLGMT